MYSFIVQVENMMMFKLKLDPFAIEERTSLLDFNFYYNEIVRLYKEEAENYKNQNYFIKSLVAIRNILNHMKLPEKA